MLGRDAVEAAAERVHGHVRRTPVLDVGADVLGRPVTLKLEQLQRSGTFKARGAFNLLLSRDVPDAGIAAASGGNYGLAVAVAAGELGHRATIFVPTISDPAKVAGLRAVGAEVVEVGDEYAEALEESQRFAAETGALLGHAYDLPEVVAGAGTVARELEQQATFDTLLVAVGGGGLIAGIATWLQDRTRIVAVETEGTPTLHAARAAGGPVDVEVSGIGADALGARRIGAHAWAANRWIDDAILVPDDDVRAAQQRLWERCRLVLEPAGAAAAAAVLSGAYLPDADERVAVLLCGANTAPGSWAADQMREFSV